MNFLVPPHHFSLTAAIENGIKRIQAITQFCIAFARVKRVRTICFDFLLLLKTSHRGPFRLKRLVLRQEHFLHY
jgi:hypothetical protein